LVTPVETAFMQSHPSVARNILDIPPAQQPMALELGTNELGFALALDRTSESTAVAGKVISDHQLVVSLFAGSQLSKRQFVTLEDPRSMGIAPNADSCAVVASLKKPWLARSFKILRVGLPAFRTNDRVSHIEAPLRDPISLNRR
jgi:hypothetical protein